MKKNIYFLICVFVCVIIGIILMLFLTEKDKSIDNDCRPSLGMQCGD